MVVALGPGKFYGSSLPRPRFYTDVKLNSERVDPPPSVMDPLLKWANEAHWSMGGLSFKRLRLQGRIEGNVERLRVQRDVDFKESHKQPRKKSGNRSNPSIPQENQDEVTKTPSPPPAPVAIKRRRVVGLLDEEEDSREAKRGAVRKLRDEFERVASESGMAADDGGSKRKEETKRTRKLIKGGRKVKTPATASAGGVRKSPRLSRTRLN